MERTSAPLFIIVCSFCAFISNVAVVSRRLPFIYKNRLLWPSWRASNNSPE